MSAKDRRWLAVVASALVATRHWGGSAAQAQLTCSHAFKSSDAWYAERRYESTFHTKVREVLAFS
jgi:hypothetical protein